MTSKELAWKIRRDTIEMAYNSKSSHIGSVLSIVDIVSVLYADIMKYDITNPKKKDRDRFILSKGHAGAAVYAALAEVGFFPVKDLENHYGNGSALSGHISHINVPGTEISTGSLGHGICVATGIAMAAKKNNDAYKVYVIVGDGECDEGSVWEAALFANHFKLDNLTVIIDHNKIQSMDTCENTLALLDLGQKWKSFGWNVIEVDGHNHEELKEALNNCDGINSPKCIVAHTVKGKGISFMENTVAWHYKSVQGEFYLSAIKELEEARI